MPGCGSPPLLSRGRQAFSVDPASEEYQALHPNAPERHAKERALLEEHFQDVDSEDDGARPQRSGSDTGSDTGSEPEQDVRRSKSRRAGEDKAATQEGPR